MALTQSRLRSWPTEHEGRGADRRTAVLLRLARINLVMTMTRINLGG